MTLTQLLNILLARKRIILLAFLVIFGLDVAITLVMPKKFTAVATVLSDPKAPDPVYGYALSTYGSATNTATQVDIITSERAGLRAVRLLGLDKSPDAIADWKEASRGKGNEEQFYSDLLLHGLDVKPSRESDVIAIQFTSASPEYAADVVNAFARAYVEISLELRTDPARASSSFFDSRTQQLRADVEKAQTRLSDFQRLHGITATDERLDVEGARLSELGTQLTAIQAIRDESQSRETQASGDASKSPDVLQNPVVQQLRTDIARSESKLQELKNQSGPNHPQIVAGQAELDSLKGKLNSEMRLVAGSVGTANTVNVQREARIKAALDEQKQRVLALRAERDEASVLQKDLEEAQKAYALVAQRRSQTNLESLNQQANVAVLSEAMPPTEPSRPRVRLNLLLGAFVGTLMGITAALGLELRDRRIRGVEDTVQTFALPILVVLPPTNRALVTDSERQGLRARMRRISFKRRILGASA
jgi:chain length determinant protein EpsF